MKYETLRKTLIERNMSRRQLAIKANIASQDLYQALNGKRPFYPKWRERSAEALDMTLEELFPEAEEEDVTREAR